MSDQGWKKELVQCMCLVAITSIIGSCVFFDIKGDREYQLQKMQIELERQKLEKEWDYEQSN